MQRIILFLFLSLFFQISFAQKTSFTKQDSLRGSITPERAWWDLSYYHLYIEVDRENKSLSGKNTIHYRVLDAHNRMQVDLQEPMRITKVVQDQEERSFEKEGNAWFIELDRQAEGGSGKVDVFFEGIPQESLNPPWAGGLTWTDEFVVTTCQGDGASLWWPCKDHMYDEPDSMLISVNVPKGLMDVSNGRLRSVEEKENGTKTYHWFVSNPISNYVINLNVADYIHFSEVYEGEKGALDCDYFVLEKNLEKAKEQFKEVPRMLDAFEHWFGPYPFYEDGFKLVEVPYPGMEHQSSVTYGNYYKNGYRGRDVSYTGIGMEFDFIIVHEAGHEWFANNITYKDIADMWVHEGFTAYSECLFVEYHWGKDKGSEYVRGTRANIRNDRPIQGEYEVNSRGSGDMYSKASNMLHTIRQVIDDDEMWRTILRGLNETFYHQTVTATQVEQYIIEKSGKDLRSIFDQYIRDYRLPVFEYVFRDDQLVYRWGNSVSHFNMPLKVRINGKDTWLGPKTTWQSQKVSNGKNRLQVDPDFYVAEMNLVK